uniref:Uncharacterized protein n=1 Tax=Arundo donax TaxID=35708 RepID=A0A0A9DQ81_ARUDO
MLPLLLPCMYLVTKASLKKGGCKILFIIAIEQNYGYH